MPGASGNGGGGIAGQATTGGGGSAAGITGSGTGGSGVVFIGGPCVTSPDRVATLEVLGRATDGRIYRRPFDGRNWGTWTAVTGLDGTMIDARSDLDCDATSDTVHVVASALAPPGALLDAFGFGSSYNAFARELSQLTIAPSPSVIVVDSDYYIGWAGKSKPAALYFFANGSNPVEYTPITSLVADLVSGADISRQGSNLLIAAYDASNYLSVYPVNISSGGTNWTAGASLPSPAGTFSFDPTVCAESGASGSFSINVAAVTGHTLWFAGTARIPVWPEFSQWEMINSDAASSPDCVVMRATPNIEAVIHVVALSARGTILDVNGNGTSWVTTDLGLPR
jgi:hypothetical protein